MEQYWCETGEHLLRKWPNTRILSYFGAQNGPEIGPILYTSLKVAPMSLYSKIDVNQQEFFLTKHSITWILTHLEAPNVPKIFYMPTEVAAMSL